MLVALLPLTPARVLHAQQPAQQGRLSAVDSTVRIGPDRPVAIGAGAVAVVEPYLAADPNDLNHLVAGVVLVTQLGDPRDPNAESELACAALTSRDAGHSWARHDFPQQDCLDPWVAIWRGNTAFLGLSGGRLFAAWSTDGERTWTESSADLGYGDHGTLAADATSGPFSGSLYAAWWNRADGGSDAPLSTVMVARSNDGGRTFGQSTSVIRWNVTPTVAMNPVVLSDGAVVVPFNAFSDPCCQRSTLAWTATSQDGGRSFSAPMLVTDACGRDFSELGVDASGRAFHDRLYWSCSDGGRVYVLHSADRGRSWSSTTVVDRGIKPVQHPAIAVNAEGVVGVSWYDTVEDPRGYRDGLRCQNVFFSASLDGGRTFLPPTKISSHENCSTTAANGEAGFRWNAGGDYHGLAAAADGRFHLLWADSRDGIYQLRTATVQVIGPARGDP